MWPIIFVYQVADLMFKIVSSIRRSNQSEISFRWDVVAFSKKFTFVELDIRQISVKADYRIMQEARYIEIHVKIMYLIFKFRHVKTKQNRFLRKEFYYNVASTIKFSSVKCELSFTSWCFFKEAIFSYIMWLDNWFR